MYDKDPYRPCCICRNNLQRLHQKLATEGSKWDVYGCSNCGSEIWIDPFKKVREKTKAKIAIR